MAIPPAKYQPTKPPFRCLRSYALDPSLSTTLETVGVSEVTLAVPWEPLAPGPVGEYLEVVDVDPASGCCYEPVRLDDPQILAQDGIAPSEGTPQFHQQMVYAAASLTIDNFEHALGRRALWRPGPSPNPRNKYDDSNYIQRLRIYPHALREANAYYSPQKMAVLMGYFNASEDDPGNHIPSSRVFTCLSHDIIAHEVTHALLDGMHRRFLVPSNPDVLAFHEAFADIVALFQHFTFPEILRHQIAQCEGDIRSHRTLLGSLAIQFGRATGMRDDLRNAIGRLVKGKWIPHEPQPNEYLQTTEPHERGSFLVAAVFDAFLSIYERRVADLMRLASGGSGILRPGAIHPDLVNRLAQEATKSAQHVLTMCIRALDYCPPTDITFGEYLRAIITADYDLVSDDDLNYRVAFIEAFRRRGIYPLNLRTLSVESLLWRGPGDEDAPPSQKLSDILVTVRDFVGMFTYAQSRKDVFDLQRNMRRHLHDQLKEHFSSKRGRRDAIFLGINPDLRPNRRRGLDIEVHTGRIAIRSLPDGGVKPQLILGLLQRDEHVPIDPTGHSARGEMTYEGGSTVIADLKSLQIRYCIRKNISSETRKARQQAFALQKYDSLRATYLGIHPLESGSAAGGGDEPFAALHRGV